jgi:hypothetical protein
VLLYVMLALAWVLSLVWLRSQGGRRAAATLFILPILAGVVWLTSSMVETRREKVLRSVSLLRSAVERGDAEAFIERISPAYDNGGAAKEDFAAVVRWAVARFRFESVRFTSGGLRFEGKTAIADRWVQVESSAGTLGNFGPQRTHWELRLGADGDGEWRLRGIICLSPARGTPETLRRRIR